MIAIDTSSVVAYLSGASGTDVEATGLALEHRQAALPPVVLSELLSDPKLRRDLKDVFRRLPLLEVLDGYWERPGCFAPRHSRTAGGPVSPRPSSRSPAWITTSSS